MTFLIVLTSLFIERVLQQHRPRRRHAWFNAYCDLLTRSGATRWLVSRSWGAVLALIPPIAAVAWLQGAADDLGLLFEWAFGSLVLLYSLGPRDIGDDAEAYLAARAGDDPAHATALAQQFCISEVPSQEPRRSLAVARAVVVLANKRLIGPLFWFVAFGPAGAAAYRAVQLMAERLEGEDCPAEMARYSDELRHVVDWAPARVTAIGYAVAGNFDAVAHAWRTFDYLPGDGPLSEAEHLLAHTGLAALDTFPDDAEDIIASEAGLDEPTPPPVVEDALALVWRSLVMWVTVIAGGSLVAALA